MFWVSIHCGFYGVKMSYSSKHAKAKHTIDIREFIKNKKKKQ